MLTNSPEPAIEVRGLTKQFGDVLAVDAVTFDVREGEMFGFLGPNGAGKTTTINTLIGLARPSAGTIRYFGHDVTRNVKRVQHLMGVVPDESNLYPEMNGFDNLCFCASLYGMRRRGFGYRLLLFAGHGAPPGLSAQGILRIFRVTENETSQSHRNSLPTF